MEIDDDKTYHLLSNAQPTLFPENCANDFTNCIEHPLRVPHGDSWEVGLKEFSCVNTLQTIMRDLHFYTSNESDKTKEKTNYTLTKGVYNETSLVKGLNQAKDQFLFSFSKVSKDVTQITVLTKPNYSLTMEPLLADILGFKTAMVNKDSTMNASEPLNLKAFSYNIVVYCDIVEESIIGGQREKVLRVIPFQLGKYYDVFCTEFIHVDYMKVTAIEVKNIRIRLMTDYGEKLPLVHGRTYVKLHFRRKAKRGLKRAF